MRLLAALALVLLQAPIAFANDVSSMTVNLRVDGQPIGVVVLPWGAQERTVRVTPPGTKIEMLVGERWRELTESESFRVPVQNLYEFKVTTTKGSHVLALPWPSLR